MACWGSGKNHSLSHPQCMLGTELVFSFFIIKHILGLGPGCPTKDCSRLKGTVARGNGKKSWRLRGST